jgi:hypothetical protein
VTGAANGITTTIAAARFLKCGRLRKAAPAMGNDDDDDTAPRAPPIPPDGGWRTMEAAAALVPELLDIVQASDNSTRMFDRLGRDLLRAIEQRRDLRISGRDLMSLGRVTVVQGELVQVGIFHWLDILSETFFLDPSEGRRRLIAVRIESIEAPVAPTTTATPPPEPERRKSGAPGQPTSMHLILNEFSRRATRGRAARRVGEEAAHLLDWFIEKYPLDRRPALRSIENAIRSAHRKSKNA